MSYLYSHQLSPNTPVDVYTLVGKYEHLVAARQYNPSSGHVFRATNLRTYFLQVLTSSTSSAANNRRVQRRFVDLAAHGEPSDRAPRTYQDSFERCRLRPYIQACAVTSRVVCFIDSDMARIAQNYMDWIEQCEDIVEEPIKPTAVIVLCGHQLQRGSEEVAFELFRHCTTTKNRSEVHSRSHRCFRRTKVLYYPKLMRPCSKQDAVNWRLLDSIHDVAELAGSHSTLDSGYYWRERVMRQLFDSSVRHFSRQANAKPPLFSIAQALTSDLPNVYPELAHQLSFFSVCTASAKERCTPAVATEIMGMYMGHHLLAHCPLLEVENFRSATQSGDALFDFIFDRRYAAIEEQLEKHARASSDATAMFQTGCVKLRMREAIEDYLAVDACITQTHLRALARYEDFFAQQRRPQRLCAGCFFAHWDDVLPCGHGFCKSCSHNYFPQWKHSAQLQVRRCPLCQEDYSEPFDVKVQPPTAGGRILSLDGGGVKGVVGLEILHEISILIGDHIPFHNLFDMAVGTSIGGVIALGLFVNRWDFATCKSKLSKLAAEIFPRKPSTHPVKGPVENILTYIKYAACIALKRSFVSGATIQTVLRQEFGKHGSMLFPRQLVGAPVKLAVTTWDTCAKSCSIITSYNRPPLQKPKTYRWLQENEADIHDEVWEAAQATSAVPFLFPAAELAGGILVDGAVTCNNPTRIALQEAKMFWGTEETCIMVLSVGYGTMKGSLGHRRGPFGACRDSLMDALSPQKQHADLALRGHQNVRLNPALDIEAVPFDDVSAISKLQDGFRSMLIQDVSFAECLRSTAFEWLASSFYAEIDRASVLSLGTEGYSAIAKIKPRYPAIYLRHLYSHAHFCSLKFEVEGRLATFAMPKKVSLRVKTLEAPIDIRLTCQTHSAQISGFPAPVTKLLRAQASFYHRKGSSKRRASRTRL